VTAASVQVVGGFSASPTAISPTPITGTNPRPDPFATLAAPSYSACDFTNFKVNGGSATLTSGVYCGGITINNATVAFGPGLYVLNGGGLTISGGSSSANGQAVTFYNTSSGYAYKPITMSGGGSVSFSAPTSGPMNGVLFFQDRSINSSSQNTLSGGSSVQLNGTLYFPTTKLVYSGGSGSAGGPTVIVADSVEFSGPSYLQ